MAFNPRQNITAGSGTTAGPFNILSAGDNAGDIKSINLANTHASNAATVNLYVYNNNSKVTAYIIKNVSIPPGVSLNLDLLNTNINTSLWQDNVSIKVTQTDIANGGVDVIISN